MNSVIRVLLVDDHALFRHGLRQLLDADADFSVVGEVGSGPEAVAFCRAVPKAQQPDIVLLDVHMPRGDGFTAVPQLLELGTYKVVMLSISDTDADLIRAMQAGASGYLLKNIEPAELLRSLRAISSGYAVIAPEVAPYLLHALNSTASPAVELNLTAREREILQCLAAGATTAQIATQLVISASTVKTHIRNLCEKLHASNRAEAVARAIQLGVVTFS